MDTLRNYTFLPWLRQGLAAEISEPDNLGRDGTTPVSEHTEVLVSFSVGGAPVSKHVQLLGPGDVVGINQRAIVKVEPRNGVTDFESNYLPYIEFYEEEFPWRFTPAKADGDLALSKLRPWIFLIVLSEDEFEDKPAGGPLPAFEIKEAVNLSDVFPDKEQTFAWAHVHVSQNVVGPELHVTNDAEARNVEQKLSELLKANPDNASSRLLCPRKLKENTAYHAFVIPAFESGRLAGLGFDIPTVGFDGQQSSWAGGHRLYPIYYRWAFQTGSKGDFEFLVDLLKPGPIDKRVGVRDLDMQRPGFEVNGMAPPFDAIGLEGALKSLEMEPFPDQWPPENTEFEEPVPGSAGKFLNELETKVNLQFLLLQEEIDDNHPDPLISPPLYGRWYAKAEKLDVQQGGWINQLNSDPRNRAAAGVGTQVIQKDQERLMQQAWSQLGDLLRANQKIRQLQLGMMASFIMYRKNILPQRTDQLIALTSLVHARVLGSPTTIARQVKESRLPQAALDPAFRKMTRSNGAIMRKVAATAPMRNRPVLTQLNKGELTAAPKPPDPTGQLSLDKVADSIAPTGIPEWLHRWLKEGRVRWALIALTLVLLFVSGAFVLFLPVIVAAGVLLPIMERLRKRIEVAETFRESSFTPKLVEEIPARPNFVLTEFRQSTPAGTGERNTDSVEAAQFRSALRDAFNVHQSPPPDPPVRQPLSLDTTAEKLKESLNPSVAIPKRAEFILKIPATIKDSYLRPTKTFVPVMAHPVFTQPMYRPLRDISSELLVPNLDLIPNNTISLMGTNQRFIEAYMVGLNHEMGLELLWREFPTDQRGSYFRQFWDVGDVVNREGKPASQLEEQLLDITKLHTWQNDTDLGNHENRSLPSGAEPNEPRLVLVVRGDLLKKYPTVVIYAQKAKWSKDEQNRDIRVLDDGNPAETIMEPIFKAEIEPDIRFLGFDLTETKAKGSTDVPSNNPGWFFVLQERPGEPRFGLDHQSGPTLEPPTDWNKLTWEHLGDLESFSFIDVDADIETDFEVNSLDEKLQWGRNAADMAYILYQVPVMVAFHAADMLT